jgi:hypothetical protein
MDAVDAKCDELGVMDAICYAVCEGQKLELLLNEANERIKRLEEELMDTKNKHAALVADVALYEDRGERIKRLGEAGDKMETRLHLRKNISDQFVYKGDAESVENWHKAKEAKL